MTYATSAEVLSVLQIFRTDLSAIETGLHTLAYADIVAELARVGINTAVDDINALLKEAEVCFYLEQATQARMIESNFGTLKEEKLGEIESKYDAGMPMFFFAQGASRPFMNLIAHESWRMRGYKLVEAFVKAYSVVTLGNTRHIYGVMATDQTKRGFNWDYTDHEVV